jgi:hypothetical protein
MNPTLDIIIVNWNAGDYLFECISSIKNVYHSSYILKSIVIVDNASQDGSLQKIENLDLPIKIIKNSENIGFSRACKIGAKPSTSDYLLFLNPDTRLFENSLHLPIDFMQRSENNQVGIVGVMLIDEMNNVSRNCARFPTALSFINISIGLDRIFPKLFPGHFMKEWDHLDSRYVDQIMGAYVLIRRSLYERLNGHDERFFVYYEDLDLSFRAHKLGYKEYYLAEAKVYHKGGGTSENVKATRLFYILHSKLLYCQKHFSKISFIIVLFFTIAVEPFTRIIGAVLKNSYSDIAEILIGYKKLISKLINKSGKY